jgi:hypothetical protein
MVNEGKDDLFYRGASCYKGLPPCCTLPALVVARQSSAHHCARPPCGMPLQASELLATRDFLIVVRSRHWSWHGKVVHIIARIHREAPLKLRAGERVYYLE